MKNDGAFFLSPIMVNSISSGAQYVTLAHSNLNDEKTKRLAQEKNSFGSALLLHSSRWLVTCTPSAFTPAQKIVIK
jgi:hypothetical protein